MNEKNVTKSDLNTIDATEFDYDNTDLPRDFDIRIEVAELQEVFNLS